MNPSLSQLSMTMNLQRSRQILSSSCQLLTSPVEYPLSSIVSSMKHVIFCGLGIGVVLP